MDPSIQRLAAAPDELSIEEAAYVLQRGRDFVQRAARLGRIEARADCGEGRGANHRYFISRAALLSYIIRSTTGERTLLLQSIAQTWPALADWARAIAAGARNPAPPSLTKHAKPAAKTASDWHPDQLSLFESGSPP